MMVSASSSSSELPQNKAVVQNMIISFMEDLLNLTTPNSDYALMAGDISIATGVISQLVTFTQDHRESKVSGEDEIKVSCDQ